MAKGKNNKKAQKKLSDKSVKTENKHDDSISECACPTCDSDDESFEVNETFLITL